jgi:uncharacterized coiled-coil DUF342 family protein
MAPIKKTEREAFEDKIAYLENYQRKCAEIIPTLQNQRDTFKQEAEDLAREVMRLGEELEHLHASNKAMQARLDSLLHNTEKVERAVWFHQQNDMSNLRKTLRSLTDSEYKEYCRRVMPKKGDE